MTRVSINKRIYRWVINRSGLPPHHIEQKFPKFRQWEAGEKQPTLKQVEDLANLTRTPLGYFFLANPPEEQLPVPHFRTTNHHPYHPSPDLIETMQVMQQRQAWMKEYLIDLGQEPLSFVGSAKIEDNPSTIAQNIREVLNLKITWAAQHYSWENALIDLRTSLENIGILITVNGVVGNNNFRKLNVKEFRGFVFTDDYAPLIFVNNQDGKAAQMFTLAHEIAHIWFNKSASFDLRELQPADDPTEKACDKVAAEFLVPESELRKLWDIVRDNKEPFQAIARYFKVSSLVGARRAKDLDLITLKQFLAFYKAYQKDERRRRRKQDGGDFYANQALRVGKLFGSSVIRAAKQGKLLYHEAYKLTGLTAKTFDQFTSILSEKGYV